MPVTYSDKKGATPPPSLIVRAIVSQSQTTRKQWGKFNIFKVKIISRGQKLYMPNIYYIDNVDVFLIVAGDMKIFPVVLWTAAKTL